MRRIALLACIVASGLAPAAAGAAPRAADFERALDTRGAVAASAGTPWTSKVIRPGRTFSVVGLKWRSARRHVDAEVRVRDARGWHRWTAVPHAHSAKGSDPVWTGRATAIQVRLERRVPGLRLHFVSVRGERARPRARAAQAGGAPAIIPRAQWGGDTECKPRDTASLGTVQMAFVHHTVSANDYAATDSAAMVLGICRFHRNSNGWDDVGYNFFVDKYGQVFEGRAGGVDQPVVGAQAQGWNAQSTGVANLGTYSDVPQTPQAIDALARLLAWKLPLHGVPVTGTVALESAGGETNRYPKGTLQTFERISGHRDGNETECPGGQLFAQLPQLRSLAASRAPDVIAPATPVTSSSKLSLHANRRALSYPEPAQLAGRLTTGDGAPIANQRVRIQVLTARGYKAVSTATTGADGAYTAELPTSRNRSVRALVGKVVSRPVKLKVAPALGVTQPARRVQAGRRSVVKGTLRPRKGTLVVDVARESRGRYRTVARVKVKVANGRFRAAIPLAKPSLYRLRVRFAGDKRNAPARADFFVRAVRRLSSVGAVQAGR
jgi:hypothetical protein